MFPCVLVNVHILHKVFLSPFLGYTVSQEVRFEAQMMYSHVFLSTINLSGSQFE